jgi:hypothetical protein
MWVGPREDRPPRWKNALLCRTRVSLSPGHWCCRTGGTERGSLGDVLFPCLRACRPSGAPRSGNPDKRLTAPPLRLPSCNWLSYRVRLLGLGAARPRLLVRLGPEALQAAGGLSSNTTAKKRGFSCLQVVVPSGPVIIWRVLSPNSFSPTMARHITQMGDDPWSEPP